MAYIATHYEGKPAILDTKARVYYFGYKNMTQAVAKANELNNEESKYA